MRLIVEFLGLARRLAQNKESLVELDDQATFRDVLGQLATQFPSLIGPVIVPDTDRSSYGLSMSYMMNIGGRSVVKDLDASADDNQRLILMFVEAGG